MESSDKVHRLADTTYRNNEELAGELHRLAAAARIYHTAMEGLAQASRQFYSTLGSIANKAANLPGSSRKLGDAAEDLVVGYGNIEKQFRGFVHSLNTDFIVPLETKLEAEERGLTDMHKAYRKENVTRESSLTKTRGQIRSLMKKKRTTAGQEEKLSQLKQIEGDQVECLHQKRTEGLRKALLEERKLYCFVLDHLYSVIRNEVAYNATCHEELSTRVNGLRIATTSPTELPAESLALLQNPHSPRAFPPSPHDMPDSATEATPAPSEAQSKKIKVKAIHPHKPTQTGQIEFKTGDLIVAEGVVQNGWQFGQNLRTELSGWFPVQFVMRTEPTSPTEAQGGGVAYQQASNGQAATGDTATTHPPLPEKDY